MQAQHANMIAATITGHGLSGSKPNAPEMAPISDVGVKVGAMTGASVGVNVAIGAAAKANQLAILLGDTVLLPLINF